MKSRKTALVAQTVQRKIRRDTTSLNTGGRPITSQEDAERLAWWEDARLGMFIHWGVFAVHAGRWKGADIPGHAEWVMHRERIPAAEYEVLARRFNPVGFDAEEWVDLAQRAGMKYIVITAKHHDGFAMFDSPTSNFDIVDATPYGRDPMKDLARACKDAGIRLGFYYSQDQDWHHPGGFGNDWDYPDRTPEDFAGYLEEKVKPQVRELLTQYGPIALIWFDTPYSISREQSLDLRGFVHSLQPDCLVSGRVGNGVGDYGSLGDNQIPAGRIDGFWETPATLNDAWGFKQADHNWKPVATLLSLLVELASKGVNYLLNVGPTADGVIPRPSVERLEAIGRWMKINGDAVYGAKASPFPQSFDWGGITQKGERLFLLFTSWPDRPLRIFGLRNRVKQAYLLADPKRRLDILQSRDDALDHDELEVRLPAAPPDERVSVVVLEIEGAPEVDATPLQQPDGEVTMLAGAAQLHLASRGRRFSVGPAGVVENWFNKANWMSWRFKVTRPGDFDVWVVTGTLRYARDWKGGHRVSVTVAGRTLARTIRRDQWVDRPRARYFPEAGTRFGRITIDKPGIYRLNLRAVTINKEAPAGLAVVSVQLRPAV